MENMDLIMGIGAEHQFSTDITKKLRVGTIKQIREVSEMTKEGLLRPRSTATNPDDNVREEQTNKWVQVLNVITIEGFTREEFVESIPEQVEAALDRFLYGQ